MIDDHKIIARQEECPCCEPDIPVIVTVGEWNKWNLRTGGIIVYDTGPPFPVDPPSWYMETRVEYNSGGHILRLASSEYEVLTTGSSEDGYELENEITESEVGDVSGSTTGIPNGYDYLGPPWETVAYDALHDLCSNGSTLDDAESQTNAILQSYYQYGDAPPLLFTHDPNLRYWRWRFNEGQDTFVPPPYLKIKWDIIKITYATTASNPPLPILDDHDAVEIIEEDLEWEFQGIDDFDPDVGVPFDDPRRRSPWYNHMDYINADTSPMEDDNRTIAYMTVNIRIYIAPNAWVPQPLGYFWDGSSFFKDDGSPPDITYE